MFNRTNDSTRGFTTLELTVAVLIAGVIAAIATPKITNALREYRVSIAVRAMADLVQRATKYALAAVAVAGPVVINSFATPAASAMSWFRNNK